MKPLYNKINEKLFIDTEDISPEIDLLPIKKWIKNIFHINNIPTDCLEIKGGNVIFDIDKAKIGTYFVISSIPPENLRLISGRTMTFVISFPSTKELCKSLNKLLSGISLIYNLVFMSGGIITGLNDLYMDSLTIYSDKKISIMNNIFKSRYIMGKEIGVNIIIIFDRNNDFENLEKITNNKNINTVSFDLIITRKLSVEILKKCSNDQKIINCKDINKKVIINDSLRYKLYNILNDNIQDFLNKNIINKIDLPDEHILIYHCFPENEQFYFQEDGSKNPKIIKDIPLTIIPGFIYYDNEWKLYMK